MQQLIVGVGHKKGRGKDTFCDLFVNHVRTHYPSIRVRKIGFADKLKDIAHQLYGWAGLHPGIYYDERYDLKEKVIEKLGKSPRQIWIEIGNYMREVYPSTWIDFALNGVEADIVLIKDMGFKNEANAVRSKGGVLVRIDRSGQPMGTDLREVELDDWTDWDRILVNDGSIRDLLPHVETIADALCKNAG